MLVLLTIAALVFGGMILLGALSLVAHILGFLIVLPFRILGFLFRFVGFLIALPFLLVGAMLLLVLGGVGVALAGGVLLLPLLPFALVVAGVVWLLKRRPRVGAV